MKSNNVLATFHAPAPFDMGANAAIIDHKKHGKLLIIQGYGGEDTLDGGAVRWRHGLCARLRLTDTSETLQEAWNDTASVLDAVLAGADDSRPLLEWHGVMIESLAESAGL